MFTLSRIRALAALPVLLLLSACLADRFQAPSFPGSSDRLRNAETALLGLDRESLLSCAGRPNEDLSLGGGGGTLVFTTGGAGGGGQDRFIGLERSTGGIGGGPGSPVLGRISSDYCEARFLLTDGRVSRARFLENASSFGIVGSPCARLVDRCLAVVGAAGADG